MQQALPPSTPRLAGRTPHCKKTMLLLLVSNFLLAIAALGLAARSAQAEEEETPSVQLVVDAAGTQSAGSPIQATSSAVINVRDLAREEALHPHQGPIRTWAAPEYEEPAEPFFPPSFESQAPRGPFDPLSPSPSPSTSFMGLDDVPMADSLYIVIPPDVGGAVGPNHVMCGFNNNYRIQDKATGATVVTLGTATFWGAVVAPSERLNLTDPRTVYDPYNDRWIAAMQTYTSGAGKILVGVSQTSDPSGAWYLYSFNSGFSLDFPDLGFNKNWISVAINRYSTLGAFQRGINLVVDYPSARTGTGTGTIVTHASSTHFCSAPCVTYSATSETLYVVTHLNSSAATYELDTVTGTPAAPVYTSGGSHTRTGGGWSQPGGNQLPQSAPNFGTSACGATPCPIEAQDPQLRSAPTFRDGSIYYAQTIGLPSGSLTHTAVQWTKIAAPSGTFSDGGRIDDPTATSTNGGKWYAYAHIAVNSAGDFILGYTQFSSSQHPGAGYSLHVAADGAGVLRDPLVYHAGDDYYHKTFSTATGRNRWGDFSTAQVDPSDDLTLWTLQEYAKTRTGINDGNTGSNSSRWSSWWAGVSTTVQYTLTAAVVGGGSLTVVPLQAFYDAGDTVHVTATPDAGWAFDSWTGDASGNANPLEVVMDSDKSITAVFVDTAPPHDVAVVDPNGGEVWNVSSVQTIDWTASDNDDVSAIDLEYSTDGGATYPDTIATGLPNSGSYAWTVPNTPTLTARIRVRAHDAAENLTTDESDADFEIHNDLTGVAESILGGREGVSAYPNPGHPGEMHVVFAVKKSAVIELSVFDVGGRLVRRLATGSFAGGARDMIWDGRDESGKAVPAGNYFARLVTNGGLRVNKRLTLLR